MDRPEFLEPTDDFGPLREGPHSVRSQADKIANQIRIERGILLRLPPLFQREQELRITALEEMHQQAKEYAFALWKKERNK